MPGEQGERVFPFLVLCGAAVALSAAIRLACSTGDLWLDEIWTLDLIGKGGPPSQVLSVHHNNNHPLNTWFLYAIGDQGDSFWRYRVHSLVAGVGRPGRSPRQRIRDCSSRHDPPASSARIRC